MGHISHPARCTRGCLLACLPVPAQPDTEGHWAQGSPKENRAVLGKAGQTLSLIREVIQIFAGIHRLKCFS